MDKKINTDGLLKEAYRYLSEYILILEYHDVYKTTDKNKIDRVKKLKEDINDII